MNVVVSNIEILIGLLLQLEPSINNITRQTLQLRNIEICIVFHNIYIENQQTWIFGKKSRRLKNTWEINAVLDFSTALLYVLLILDEETGCRIDKRHKAFSRKRFNYENSVSAVVCYLILGDYSIFSSQYFFLSNFLIGFLISFEFNCRQWRQHRR